MPLSPYQEAFSRLAPADGALVGDAFKLWMADAALHQVFQNISGETALQVADVVSLLNSFAMGLTNGETPIVAWQNACRSHKLRAREIPAAACPSVLGRAKGLEDHAAHVAKVSRGSGGLTKEAIRKLLLKHSAGSIPSSFEYFLRAAPLGNHNLVWATFDPVNPAANPFNALPASHNGICTALGLGLAEDTLIILVWDHANSGSPPLHRPSAADAEIYHFYRPNSDLAALWGLTEPLSPNPGGLKPQPEVVMPDPTSKGLLLPFLVVQA
jgi:hypothetical protein